MTFDRLLGKNGHPGRNLAIDRNVCDSYLLNRRDQSPGLARVAIEKSLSLEGIEVLHDRGLTGESKMLLDFAGARRDPFLSLLALDEAEDFLLSAGEHDIILV